MNDTFDNDFDKGTEMGKGNNRGADNMSEVGTVMRMGQQFSDNDTQWGKGGQGDMQSEYNMGTFVQMGRNDSDTEFQQDQFEEPRKPRESYHIKKVVAENLSDSDSDQPHTPHEIDDYTDVNRKDSLATDEEFKTLKNDSELSLGSKKNLTEILRKEAEPEPEIPMSPVIQGEQQHVVQDLIEAKLEPQE